MKNVFFKFLAVIGIFLIFFGFYLLYLRTSPIILAFEEIPNNIVMQKAEKPVKISIQDINVNLPVVPAISKNGVWETTHLGVSYLSTSPLPGDYGNSILYGHNWKNLLGDLPKVKPGNKISISYDNGQKKEFTVEYTAVVSPNQTDVIKSTNDTRITIYTCTGFLDSKRFVVVAKPTT